METLLLQKPREIKIAKPARVLLVGGFLGAGKTTAITALAERLTPSPLK